MLNVLGNNKVYTVPEIDALLKKTTGFVITDKLPEVEDAKENLVYYKRSKEKFQDLIGYCTEEDPNDITLEEDETHTVPVYMERPMLIPYIAVKENDSKVWYTSGGGSAKDHRGLTTEEIMDIWNSCKPSYKLLRSSKHIAIKGE